MHDVLAHRLSLHAGALEYHADASSDEARQAAGVIRDSARVALEELREVIGVLREDEDAIGTEPPQPTLDRVGALVDESRAAGMRVALMVQLTGGAPPDAAGRTAYRIVQEGLTNARKHAPGAAVEVTIRSEAAPGHRCLVVIVLTTFDADELVLRALQAGASGFLLKDTPPSEIVRAIELVHGGDAMLSPAVTRRLIGLVAGHDDAGARRDAARARLAALSPREREVALTVGEGCANTEIGARLHMSVATVKAHVSQLLTKLELDNRVQVALLVHDAGLR